MGDLISLPYVVLLCLPIYTASCLVPLLLSPTPPFHVARMHKAQNAGPRTPRKWPAIRLPVSDSDSYTSVGSMSFPPAGPAVGSLPAGESGRQASFFAG